MSYIKISYLYAEHQFNLYKPIQIVEKIYNRSNKVIGVKFIEPDGTEGDSCISNVVESFVPDQRNMLYSEYKGIYISVITDHCFHGKYHWHRKAIVLPEKRGTYTMARCTCCGQESPLAMNSFIIADKFDKDLHFQCSEKTY